MLAKVCLHLHTQSNHRLNLIWLFLHEPLQLSKGQDKDFLYHIFRLSRVPIYTGQVLHQYFLFGQENRSLPSIPNINICPRYSVLTKIKLVHDNFGRHSYQVHFMKIYHVKKLDNLKTNTPFLLFNFQRIDLCHIENICKNAIKA